ncbi:MAG: sodium:calcium symporter [Planctomycetaceae bacterium]|nr:sodium:calcium symporter [Planctomycetaceae bacterium]
MKTRKKENWGSQLGVILAVAGSAVGLGNFLRFPGQVATHGGGAFMIPYFISFLLLAIPLSWSEWALGRYGGRCGFNSAAGIFSLAAKGRKRWAYVGALGAYLPICISMYYLFVEAWCLAFAIQYFTGILASLGLNVPSFLPGTNGPGLFLGSGEAYSNFFASFVGANANGSLYQSADGGFTLTPLLGCSIFCLILNYFLIYRGITKGIEAFCKVAMPLLLLCSLIILFRALTLPNPIDQPGRTFLDGLGFMWNPARPGVTIWDSLSNPEVWVAATSQIFFSVSVGFGLIVTYSSYVRETDDIALSGLTATVSNEFCEVVIAGLMIIPPAIMFLGAQAVEGNLDTFSLGFNVLPNVFEKMPCGQFFGFIFFFLLFLAAVTSSLSQVQPSVALLEEGMAYGRKISVFISAIFSTIGTLILCHYSKAMFALDTFDFWVGNFGIIFLAILQTYLIGWIWGTPRMIKELSGGARIKVPFFIGPIMKYVSLPYLLIISGFWLYQNSWSRFQTIAEEPLARMIVGFLVLTALFYGYVTWKTLKRWKEEGKDLVRIARESDEEWVIKKQKSKVN